MSIFDFVLKELLWIPVGLFIGFIVIKYQKFTKLNRHKRRGYHGGEGYLSNFPDDNTDRHRQNRNYDS